MTSGELEFVKKALRQLHDAAAGQWLEVQILRNLILEEGWESEAELDARLARSKADPENLRLLQEHFAAEDAALPEIGLADWLAEIEKRFPRSS